MRTFNPMSSEANEGLMVKSRERIVDHVSIHGSILLVLTNFRLYSVDYKKFDQAFLIQKFNFDSIILHQNMSYCPKSGYLTVLSSNLQSMTA